MNCDTTRELLITDYIDNELDPKRREAVKRHLAGCPGCSAFEAEVLKTAVRPFKGISQARPPRAVWENIAFSIGGAAAAKRRVFPGPALFTATLAAVIIAAAIFLNYHYDEQRSLGLYIEEELGYLSSLGSNTASQDDDILAGMDLPSDSLSRVRNFSQDKIV